MKKTDFAMIILIASVSVGIAFGVVSAIPGLKLSGDPVKIKTIDKYTSDLSEPDPRVFNKDAINPTVDVTIGSGAPETNSDDLIDNTTDEQSTNSGNTTQPNSDDTTQSSEQ